MLILAFRLCRCVKRVDNISDGEKNPSIEENLLKNEYIPVLRKKGKKSRWTTNKNTFSV